MKLSRLLLHKTFFCLVVLLAATVAHANVVTITGSDVTLLNNANSVYDGTKASGTVTGSTRVAQGELGKFDAALGVLTGATATSTAKPGTSLVKTGGTGSAYAYSSWSLGGNSSGSTTINSINTSQGLDATWNPTTVTSSAANLNNFVGTGNIATNNFSSYLTVYWASGTVGAGAFTGTSLTQHTNLFNTESIAYTYTPHGDASFAQNDDVDTLTLDFGKLAFGSSHDESFNIFNRIGLGLTNFALSFLGGDDLFSVTGGDLAAGATGGFNAHFNGQTPLSLSNYEGLYRLTFTDDVRGLSQYASNSIGTDHVDLRILASVAPIPAAPVSAVPEPATMLLLGTGLAGLAAAGKRKKA